MILSKRTAGIEMSETDQQWLDRADGMKSLAEAEIQNLNSQIKDLREEGKTNKRIEKELRMAELKLSKMKK